MTAPTAVPGIIHLDVYDVAYLAGGPHRVVDTALVALAESGLVRVQVTGELSADGAPRRRHPVEAAVLDAIGPRARWSPGTVRWKLEDDPRITTLGDRLAAAGLLTGRRRPALGGGAPVPLRTRAGRRALRALRADPPEDRVAPGTSALPVALTGPRAMADAELREQLFTPPRPPRRTGRPWGPTDGTTGWSAWYPPGGWAWGGDGGGFGGGFGGGDGGGCGGGDGGGGGGSC